MIAHRLKNGILAPKLAVVSLGVSGLFVWLLKVAVDDHAGPGAGILFVPFLVVLAGSFFWDIWDVLKRANQLNRTD